MSRANNPYECGFDTFCQLDRETDFIGRTALEGMVIDGPARRVRGLEIDAESLPTCRTPWPVVADGERVGQVSSVAMSPRFECGVAIGMIDASHWTPSTEVTVVTPEGDHPATVVQLPFGDGPSTASKSAGRKPPVDQGQPAPG